MTPELEAAIARLHAAKAEIDSWLANATEAAQGRMSEIVGANRVILERYELMMLKAALSERDGVIRTLQEKIVERDRTIKELRKEKDLPMTERTPEDLAKVRAASERVFDNHPNLFKRLAAHEATEQVPTPLAEALGEAVSARSAFASAVEWMLNSTDKAGAEAAWHEVNIMFHDLLVSVPEGSALFKAVSVAQKAFAAESKT